MRILHTSDWHLGKTLEGYSRLEEQKAFLDELYEICVEEKIDMMLVAGDIYDSANPPAEAEKLFYHGVNRIAEGGKRPVLLIAGNHDSPERLTAAYPLAYEQGIIMIGTPKTVAQAGAYGSYEISEAGEGYLKLRLRGEELIVLLMPYPSERRLGEYFQKDFEEKALQKSYSERVGALFRRAEEYFLSDTINIAIGHFYVAGGEESPSERQVQLGGSLSVQAEDLPKKAQYIALGHLHRSQTVPGAGKRAYYSGAPLAFRKEESVFTKQVFVISVMPGEEAEIKKVPLTVRKPILEWKAGSIAEAIAFVEEKKDTHCYLYLTIQTDRVLTQEEIKRIKGAGVDVVEITPVFPEQEGTIQREAKEKRSLKEEFTLFYQAERGVAPTEELIDLFLSIAQEEEQEPAAL